MAILIDAPARTSRSQATALTSYYQLDTSLFERNANRWAFDGVTFVPTGCDESPQEVPVDPCDPAVVSEGTSPNPETEVTFPPFGFQTDIKCTSLSMTGAELKDYLTTRLDSILSAIFAAQTAVGEWNAAAPTLSNQAVDVGGNGMLAPKYAVAAIEDGLADTWGDSVGMIHVTPGVFSVIAGDLEQRDGRYFTHSGHVVVADAGYQGGAPDTGTVTPGQPWIYGSSPVHYRYVTPNFSGADWENYYFPRDEQIVRIDGFGIVVFEPCSAVAAKVNYSP